MSDNELKVAIKQRIDLKENWEANNPKLRLGELGIEAYDETNPDTGVTSRNYRIKIGDSVHNWNDLPYFTYNKSELDGKFVNDGAGASKVAFSSPLYTSKNVSAALNEVWGYVEDVENAVEKSADECFEIKYSSAHSGLTSLTNAQQAFDYITDYIGEYTPDLGDVVFDPTVSDLKDNYGVPITNSQTAFDMLYAITAKNASGLSYDNALSELAATNVQAGIDELVQKINDLSASAIAYTNKPDETTEKTVQGCLDALWTEIHTIYDYGVSKELASFDYDNTVTQIRIDESDPTIYDTLNAQGVIEYCIKRFNSIVQNLEAAIGVTFDPTGTHIAVGSNLQTTTEQLDTALYNLKEYVDKINATQVIYDDSDPDNVVMVSGKISDIDGRVKTIEDDGASAISYTNTTSQMTATTVQAAIDELDGRVDNLVLEAKNVSYDDSVSQLSDETTTVDTVQKAVEKLDSHIDTINDTLDDFDGATLEKFSTNNDGDLMWGTIKIGGTDDSFHKKASEITYDNTVKSILTDTTAQGALDSLSVTAKTSKTRLDELDARDVAFNGVRDICFVTTDSDVLSYDETQMRALFVSYGYTIDESKTYAFEYKNEFGHKEYYGVSFTPSYSIQSVNIEDIEGWNYEGVTNVNEAIGKLESLRKAEYTGFTPTTTIASTDVQGAIETLETKINEVIVDFKAENVSYDDTTSKLGDDTTDVDTVQKAIEAIDSKVDNIELKAEKVTFDPGTTGMISTNLQAGVEELDGRIDAIEDWTADDIPYTTQDSGDKPLSSTDVRSALDEVNDKVNNIAANKNTAGDITYDNVDGKITDPTATDVQKALDVLAEKISGTEGKISNKAVDIVFDTTKTTTATSPITKTNVEDALIEVNEKLDTIAENKNTAGDISYDNTTTGLTADTVQEAIDNIVNGLDTNASDIEYDNTGTSLTDIDNAQDAITELASRTDSIPSSLADVSFDSTKTGWTSITTGQQAVDKLSESKNIAFDTTYAKLVDDYGNPITDVQGALDSMYGMYSRFSGQKASYVTYDPTSSGRTASINLQNAMDRAFSEIDQAVAKIYDKAQDIKYENEDYPSLTNVKLALDKLLKQVFYVKPEITSFTCVTHTGSSTSTATTYEVGYQIDSVDFAWTINKTLASQLLTGCSITADDRSATYSTAFNADKTFRLIVTDKELDTSGVAQTASADMKFVFYPGVYFGCGSIPATYDNAFVTGLSGKKLQKDRTGTYTFNAGANDYCFFAWPTSYGTVTEINIGGFATSVLSCGTTSVTNAYGDTRAYQIYRLAQKGLGSITAVVS